MSFVNLRSFRNPRMCDVVVWEPKMYDRGVNKLVPYVMLYVAKNVPDAF